MQDFSGLPQNKTSSDSDRDRSMNVVLFSIAENRDASVWRQGVLDAFHHILGRSVETDDMFRIDRYISGKIPPVTVKLHSAWDRRLLIRGSFKL